MTVRTNSKRAVLCTNCYALIPIGQGFVYRCPGGDRCPAPALCERGWHCICSPAGWMPSACRNRRARIFVQRRRREAAPPPAVQLELGVEPC